MKVKLNAIFFDGPDFSGKSSQISVLANHLRNKNIDFKRIKIQNLEDVWLAIQEIKSSDKLVIVDGSLNYFLCQDLTNDRYQNVEDVYKTYLNRLREVSSSNNVLNIILVPDDMSICSDFHKKVKKMYGDKVQDYDISYQTELLNYFKILNNHYLTRDMQYKMFSFFEKDTILNVHNGILKEVEKDFYFK